MNVLVQTDSAKMIEINVHLRKL